MYFKTGKIPEDPSDKMFLTICFVCMDIAKPGQEHLRNYGGIVCYSCRAFWRRSHQQSRCPNFVCKKANQCVVSVATRRKCQKCRYERCLLAGMKPDAVLDPEQKKVRFRKLLKKQQKFLSSQMKVKVPIPVTLKYFPSTENLERYQQILSRKKLNHGKNLPHFQTFESGSLSHEQNLDTAIPSHPHHLPSFSFMSNQTFRHPFFDPNHQLYDNCDAFQWTNFDFDDCALDLTVPLRNDFISKGPSHPNAKVEDITKNFIRIMFKIGCPNTEYLIVKLVALQGGLLDMKSVSKSELQFLVLQLSRAFRLFAYTHSEFCELHPTDQQKILAKNTPLFIQLYIGQFLLVEPRHSPATADKHPKKVWINNFDQNRYLERFNAATNLFVPGADLHEYGNCIAKLKDLPELTTFRQKAIVAHVILFSVDESFVGWTNRNFDSIFNDFIRTCENCSSLFSLTENLKEMADFCAKNITW